MAESKKSCGCACHKFNGLMVAVLGLTFLLLNLDVISAKVANIIWPSLIILVGLKKSVARGMCSCCNHN